MEKIIHQNQLPGVSEVISIQGGTISIITDKYIVATLDDATTPSQTIDFFRENTVYLSSLLDGTSLGSGKKRGSLEIPAKYIDGEGIVRLEEITSFATIINGEISYLSRRRPALENSNTPGEKDPGVFSHGGLKQAGIINAWRYVADKVQKNDGELTDEEYKNYLEQNPFPKYQLIDLGRFILTNGHKARNQTPPTSGLMNARIILISPREFYSLLQKNNSESVGFIEYTSIRGNDDSTSFTPKHKAFHQLLQGNSGNIQDQFDVMQRFTDDIKNQIGNI